MKDWRTAMKLGTGVSISGNAKPVFPWVTRGEDPPGYEVKPNGEVSFMGRLIGSRKTEYEARMWAWYRWTHEDDHEDDA